MSKTWLIIQREYLTRVKKKSFIIMTILGPLVFVGFMALAAYITQSDNREYDVVIADRDGQFGKVLFMDEFKKSDRVTFHLHEGALSEVEFKESPYDLMLDVMVENLEAEAVQLYYKEKPDFQVEKYITERLQQSYERGVVKRFDISQDVYERIKAGVILKPIDIDRVTDSEFDATMGWAVGFALAIMIYMFIFLYGAQVMRGVMEEKTSRIVEVIISSVKPFQLMLGKIIGVAMVGLTQFLLWVLLSTVLMSVMQTVGGDAVADPGVLATQQMTPGMADEVSAELAKKGGLMQDIFAIYHQTNVPFILGMFLFYFLGGYLLYGSLFAAVGAAVDNDSDTQQFMLPLSVPLIFGFIVAEMAINNPDGAAVFWTSIIPFTSPIVMMIKVGMMGMGFQEMDYLTIGLSMLLLILGFLGTTWVASRIYRVGILMYGKKVSYKEIWKWVRYY